jgi:hypothetical protein
MTSTARRRFWDRAWVVAPWVLAAIGVVLLGRELGPSYGDSAVSPPAQVAPDPRPQPEPVDKAKEKTKEKNRDDLVYEPWERVST